VGVLVGASLKNANIGWRPLMGEWRAIFGKE